MRISDWSSDVCSSDLAAMLVQNGVPPEKILLLTFSRASSKEMLARAKALDSRCAFIDGGTFHATATKIINQNIHVFGMDRPFTILDPEDAKIGRAHV